MSVPRAKLARRSFLAAITGLVACKTPTIPELVAKYGAACHAETSVLALHVRENTQSQSILYRVRNNSSATLALFHDGLFSKLVGHTLTIIDAPQRAYLAKQSTSPQSDEYTEGFEVLSPGAELEREVPLDGLRVLDPNVAVCLNDVEVIRERARPVEAVRVFVVALPIQNALRDPNMPGLFFPFTRPGSRTFTRVSAMMNLARPVEVTNYEAAMRNVPAIACRRDDDEWYLPSEQREGR